MTTAATTTTTRYLVLPVDQTLPWYEFQITLDGVRYLLEMRYNLRMDRWVLALSDASGSLIVCGIPLLAQRDLLAQYTTLKVPPKALYVLDQTGTSLQPGLQGFLTTHLLIYAQ